MGDHSQRAVKVSRYPLSAIRYPLPVYQFTEHMQ